jgi:hypothetical protein
MRNNSVIMDQKKQALHQQRMQDKQYIESILQREREAEQQEREEQVYQSRALQH